MVYDDSGTSWGSVVSGVLGDRRCGVAIIGIVTNFSLLPSIDEASNHLQRKKGRVSRVAHIAKHQGQDLTPIVNLTHSYAVYTAKFLEYSAMLVSL